MKNNYDNDYVISYIKKNNINDKVILGDVALSAYYAGCSLLTNDLSLVASLPLIIAVAKADHDIIKNQSMLEDARNHNIAKPLKLERVLEFK